MEAQYSTIEFSGQKNKCLKNHYMHYTSHVVWRGRGESGWVIIWICNSFAHAAQKAGGSEWRTERQNEKRWEWDGKMEDYYYYFYCAQWHINMLPSSLPLPRNRATRDAGDDRAKRSISIIIAVIIHVCIIYHFHFPLTAVNRIGFCTIKVDRN